MFFPYILLFKILTLYAAASHFLFVFFFFSFYIFFHLSHYIIVFLSRFLFSSPFSLYIFCLHRLLVFASFTKLKVCTFLFLLNYSNLISFCFSTLPSILFSISLFGFLPSQRRISFLDVLFFLRKQKVILFFLQP